eukprot:2002381-Amphidinium_carterae.1
MSASLTQKIVTHNKESVLKRKNLSMGQAHKGCYLHGKLLLLSSEQSEHMTPGVTPKDEETKLHYQCIY